jgi:lipopolysaccharide export system protein LptC
MDPMAQTFQNHEGRQALYERAARHTSRVMRIKKLLIGLCALIVCIMLIFVFWPDQKSGGFDLLNIELSGDALTMSSPRLTGYDDNNNPYEVSARQATQALDTPDVVTLDDLDARITFDGDEWAHLKALQGTLDTKKRFLTLQGGLELVSSLDYTLSTAKADIDLAQSRLILPGPVQIDGPDGSLEAQTGSIDGKNKIVIFENKVKVVIKPSAQNNNSANQEQQI